MSGDIEKEPVPSADDRSEEINRSGRLQRLGERLDQTRAEEQAAKSQGLSSADKAGAGQAMRFSSEFIASVIGGALLGWVIDWLFGTSPWGLIIFLMLGFAAGIMNVMRAAGMIGQKSPRM